MDHFIKIAEIKVIKGPGLLKTVVGSCIALCLWDEVKRIGGMVHIMMPEGKNRSSLAKGRYADTAVTALTEEMIARNCCKRDMLASVIGGASLFGNKLVNSKYTPIGMANYEAVKAELILQEIPVSMQDIGGTSGRRVTFNCETGNIVVNMLNRNSAVTVKEVVQ